MKLTAEFKFMSLLIGAAILAAPLHASFEPLPLGARAAGMGEAYSAIADDVYSLYYNPAGVLQINRPEIGSYYSRVFMGLTDNSEINRIFLGYAQPLGHNGKNGALGASYTALELPGLYKEESLGLTYGREYKHLYNIGGTLKLLRKKIGSDDFTANAINPLTGEPTNSPDPLLASQSQESAFGVDLGLQYRLTQAYALGVTGRNINSPNIGLGSDSDKVPAIYAVALARHLRTGSIDVELMNWKSHDTNNRFSIGGEKWFDNGFAMRAGGALGSRNYSTISFGASYKMESIQFDYATVFPLQGVDGTLGTQQVSFTMRLGKPPVDPLEQQLIHEKEERIKAETEARYAKAERDRLKKQLLALTQAKSQKDLNKEKKAAQKALDDANVQRDESNRLQQESSKEAFNDYADALADYNTQVRSGLTLKKKKEILNSIKKRFRRSGVDLSTVEREIRSLRVEEARAKKDFELSMNFYRRLVQQGASKNDRSGMLKRIIEKYKGTGINIDAALDEMKTLK